MKSPIFNIKKTKKRNTKKFKWDIREDKFIIDIKKKIPKIKWKCLSKAYNEHFKTNKNTFLIRSRLKYFLNPKIQQGRLSEEEKNKIMENYKIYGPKWSKISKHIPSRNDQQIKNYFYSSLRKRTRESYKMLIKKNEEVIKKSKLRLLSKKNFDKIYEQIVKKKISFFDIDDKKIQEILLDSEMEDSSSKPSSRKDAPFEVKKSYDEISEKSSTGFSLIKMKCISNYEQNVIEENINYFQESKNSMDSLCFSEKNAKFFDFDIISDEIYKTNDTKMHEEDFFLNNYNYNTCEDGNIFKGLFFN